MSAAMARMHEEMASPALTVDPDRDFLTMMIPHHVGAIEMARIVLIYEIAELTRTIAHATGRVMPNA